MNSPHCRLAWCALVAGALAIQMAQGGAVVSGQSEARAWQPITAERLLHPEPGDWLNYRRTYDVSGYSPLRQINRANVKDLRPVWSYSVSDTSRWLPTPIVANGLMYVSEGRGRVLAFDVASGDVVWIHERRYPEDIGVSEAYQRARGVSIYGDRIYWGTADCALVALDARTGKLVWEVETCDYRTGDGHNHPPLIADGKILLGQAGGDITGAGRFRAFDVETGRALWTVYTAPRPGDPGFETWTRREVPPLGAAPWNTASYDPELQLVYFATGQPTPWSAALRGPGDALYSNTVLAVDVKTGQIRWHFQLNPEDSWDRAGFESVLVDLVIDGRRRQALVQTGKMGWGVVLDRRTGEFLRAFRTAHDNVVTGWTAAGRPIVSPSTQPTPADLDSGKEFDICPHIHGARNLQASSYSPDTGLYYLGVNNTCMTATISAVQYVVGRAYMGVRMRPKLVPGLDYVGEFAAFDPLKDQRAWTYRTPNGAAMTASALSTAGGLVFGGTSDRQLFALDAETGALLWQTRLNGDISGAPITFEVDGTQYLAVGAGGRAAPTTSFGPLTGVDIPRGSGVMWVFALPSAAESAARPVTRLGSRAVILSTSGVPAAAAGSGGGPPATANAAAGRTPALGLTAADGRFTAGQAAQGQRDYNSFCTTCHSVSQYTGAAFHGKWGGGTLDDVFEVISTAMPQDKPGSLAAESYVNIVAFLLSQSGYTPGSTELPVDRAILRQLRIRAALR